MNTNVAHNRRLGLAVLATVAVIAVILLVPGIALGLSSNYDTNKDVYKVGEDVIGNASIKFNGSAQEVAKIQSAKLKVQPKPGSSKPGSESFEVNLPLGIGNHDLTNSLPASMRSDCITFTRCSTLEVDVTWTDLGPATGGYAVGYKGATLNARIDFVIRWKPPIKRAGEAEVITPLDMPVPTFPNPQGSVGGGGALAASFMFEIPGFDPVAPEGATVLGLAFDRFNGTLLALMDNPIPGGNDTILVLHPAGFIMDAIDTGTPNAQDVAWLGNPSAMFSKFTTMPGAVWIAIQSGGTKQIKQVIPIVATDTPISLTDGLPLRGLGALSYTDPLGNQHILPSFFQAVADLSIPVHMVRPDTGVDETTMFVVAGPTGGGYNDVEVNDAAGGPPSGIGAFGDKLGQFDIPSGFFLGSKNVASGGSPLTNLVGLAMDSGGTLYLANQASPGTIYSVSLAGGGGGPVGEFARAITGDPDYIYMVMDNTGPDGKDEIVRVDGVGVGLGTEVNRYTAPGSEHEGLVFLGGFLYTVDNGTFPLTLYKLAPATGAVQGSPKELPPIVDQLGDLTVNAAGNRLIGVGRYSDKLYEIDPATGGVTSTKTMVAVPPAFNPFGMEGLTLVTGVPTTFLLGAKGTGFFFINIDTGSIYDFKFTTVFPPFNLTGLMQRGGTILMTDDSQQVFRASVPGMPPADDTVAGDYESIFTVALDPPGGSPPAVTAPFSIERVTILEVTITDPKDGASFTSTPITVSGLVNDPTVKQVTLGIDLPITNLLGPSSFENGLAGYTTTGMWHRTNDFGGKPPRVAGGTWSLAYTRDTWNQGGLPPGDIYTYQTIDTGTGSETANSGTATSSKFSVGSGTLLSLKTWYDTEPNFFGPFGGGGGPQFDNKFIKVLTYNAAGTTVTATTTLAQIVSFPPPTAPGSPPGTVFTDPGFAPHKLVFIPTAMFDPFTGNPVFTKIELGMDAFLGQKVAVQFAFDTVDPFGNFLEGWFVDVVGVTGAGSSGDQLVDVVNGVYSGSFALATGSNKIKVTATRTAYAPQSVFKIVTVSLDVSNPILRLLLSEDVNGNGALNTNVGIDLDGDGIVDIKVDEDMNGDSLITKLAGGVPDPELGKLVTKTASQTVFGVFQEANPVLLTVTLNDKLVLSLKSANLDPDKPTFSTSINLVNGLNTIVVSMTDAGGLKPDPDALKLDGTPLNRLVRQVILDNTAPSLAALGTIYPFTALQGKPGDPVVYQVNASDAETGIAKVEILVPAVKTMIAASDTPLVLRDQWGTTGNYLFPTVISASTPAGGLSLIVQATDKAGNVATGAVQAQVNASMTAWNICLQRSGNLVATPIQPTNGNLATLLNQKVKNVSPAFKATLVPQGAGGGDLSMELDADGDVTLRNVINSIQYWPGGTSTTDTPLTFKVYTPDPSADTLATLQEGKGYWAFTKTGAFKPADPLPGFTESSYSCMNLTIAGMFLAPGAVPPTFSEKAGWNAVGAHLEGEALFNNNSTVLKFLKGLSPESQAALGSSSSLLAFKNGIEFDYANTADKTINDRVSQKSGAFEVRFNNSDVVLRGEGFWLFLLADGLLVP